MTLSICIPVYNQYVVPLVEHLAKQCAKMRGVETELVCIDDCSTAGFRERNRGIEQWARTIYLKENVGRARIRNLFLENTNGEWLLFLDNDLMVGDDFVARYVDAIAGGAPVVVGGLRYEVPAADARRNLRVAYGRRVECRTAAQRRQAPYSSFMTGNFMISRELFADIRFDERLHGYGHEDTLFGYQLQRREVAIDHIDNPVIVTHTESNEEFLKKSRQAVDNMAYLYSFMGEDREFCRSVRMLRTYRRVRKWGMTLAVRWGYRLMRGLLENHFLTCRSFSPELFGFYKLGYFIDKVISTATAGAER